MIIRRNRHTSTQFNHQA